MSKVLVFSADSAEQAENLGLVMEFGGHHCTAVRSLQEALAVVQNDHFDLVVAHLQLNHVVVEGIAKILKGASPGITVMVLSKPSVIATAADEVLALPCTPEALFGGVERAIKRSSAVKKTNGRARRRPSQPRNTENSGSDTNPAPPWDNSANC